MTELNKEEILGLWRLRSLLHELKANLFAALARGEKCVLKLVAGSLETPPIDGACSAIVRACHEHLQICKLEIDGLKDLPIYMSPVIPMTAEEFDGSELDSFFRKIGIGYDVLLFLDSIEEVMHLSEQSQSDPDFAARIEVIQVACPPPTTAAATPTAGSCGLRVSWAAFELLEMLGLLASRYGPSLFLGDIDGTGGEELAMKQALNLAAKAMLNLTQELHPKFEDKLWNQTDTRLDRGSEAAETAEEMLLRGMVSSLKEQNDLQRSEIVALRSRPAQESKEPKELVDAEVQTVNDTGCDAAGSAADATCEAQQMQLDMLHQEVGNKSRELRRSQDTVKLLRSELEQQRQVSEQFRLQTEMLEEQLRRTNERLKKLEKTSAEVRHMTSTGEMPEMPSSSLPKSWKGSSACRCFSDDEAEGSSADEQAQCAATGSR
ncbi:unnamed protein product [Symbiodinium natans]|uniref:Uncharacterized protein n=1 Tax=Symbiodinium natans TaxID=878477 RepID=A0A812PHB9_9DINO|nr:unnamed protein product [Symbiodinium natans]